jgi:hypothetical protein
MASVTSNPFIPGMDRSVSTRSQPPHRSERVHSYHRVPSDTWKAFTYAGAGTAYGL